MVQLNYLIDLTSYFHLIIFSGILGFLYFLYIGTTKLTLKSNFISFALRSVFVISYMFFCYY